MTDPIYLEKDGAIGWLVLNRPDKRNALTQAMWQAIPGLVAEAEGDSQIKLLIVRGASAAAFCAGADIAEFTAFAADPERLRQNQTDMGRAMRALAGMVKPSLALIQGSCIGGGCGLALACDLRYADSTAKFAITPSRLGLVYSLFDTRKLVDAVGPAAAKAMLFTGRVVDAQEARHIGLADAVYEPEALEGAVRDMAAAICAASQVTVRGAKKIIGKILAGATEDSDETRAMFLDAFQGPDHAEGVAAFLEKRKPDFTVS